VFQVRGYILLIDPNDNQEGMIAMRSSNTARNANIGAIVTFGAAAVGASLYRAAHDSVSYQSMGKILRHLNLWERPERPPPRPAGRSIHYDEEIVDVDGAGQWPDATA
jgi:hypothetical protein